MEIDKFNVNDNQLFQVMQNFQLEEEIMTWEYSPYILGASLKESFPEVEDFTATNDRDNTPRGLLSKGDQHISTKGLFAKENFFEVFTYPLLRGEVEEVLVGTNNIVISDELAIKLFHSLDSAIGETVEWSTNKTDTLFKIAGFSKVHPKMQLDNLMWLFILIG